MSAGAISIARLRPGRKVRDEAGFFALLKRRPDDYIQEAAGRVRESIQGKGFTPGPIALALDSGKALIQKVAFPFSDIRKIKRVLPYELENHLPVPAAEYVWDFLTASRKGRQETVVFAALYPREEVQDWVSQLEAQGFRIQGVELDLTVLNARAERYAQHGRDNQLFLDMHWTRTGLVWRRENTLLAFRSLSCGLKDVFAGLDLEQEAFDLETLQNSLKALQQQEIQDLVQGAGSRTLGQQIKMTCLQAGDSCVPSGVVLSGPGGGLAALTPVLEELTGLPVCPWQPVGKEQHALGSQGLDGFFQVPALVSLQQGTKPGFDYLPQLQGNGDSPRLKVKQVLFPAIALLVMLASYATSMVLDITHAQRRLEDIQHRVEDIFYTMLPDADPDLRPLQYAGVIRSRIQKLQSGPSGNLEPRIKVTRALWSLSRALPKDLGLQVRLLTLDGLSFRVNGVAPDFKTVDHAKNRLSAETLFTGVEIVGANADPEGKAVNFSLRLSLADSTPS